MRTLVLILICFFTISISAQKKTTTPKSTKVVRNEIKPKEKYPNIFLKESIHVNKVSKFKVSTVRFGTRSFESSGSIEYFVHITGEVVDDNDKPTGKKYGIKHDVKTIEDLEYYQEVFEEKNYKKIHILRFETGTSTKTYVNTGIEIFI